MPVEVSTVAVYGGDSLTLEYRFKDALDAAVDVSAYTFTAQWRSTPGGDSSVAFTVDDTDAATGIIILSMTGEQTASMRSGGYFDLQGTAGSTVRTFVKGKTTFESGVTRA